MELGDKLVETTGDGTQRTERQATIGKALKVRWSGLMVFVSKETKEKLERMIGEPVTQKDVREFIEGVANGEYMVTPKARKRAKRMLGAQGPTNGHAVSVAEGPVLWTMQQVAKRLNVQYGVIYTRARQGRIVTVREGKRYLVPTEEVARLEQVGL